MNKGVKLPGMPMKEFDRRAHAILQELQRSSLPEHAADFVAINVETGEHVLASTEDEAGSAFRQRWPEMLPYLARVDGRPMVKFYGR